MDYVTRPGARVFPGDGTCDAPGPRAGPGGFSEGLTRAPGRARALPFLIINRAGPGGYPAAARPGRCPCLCCVRGLGVEEVVDLEVRIEVKVATRARGAGGGRLQANELAAAI